MESNNKLSIYGLTIVYNESVFMDYAIESVLPFLDKLIIVEGAFLENIKNGYHSRSTDGTIDKLLKWKNKYQNKIFVKHTNEKSDPNQREVALNYIKHISKNDNSIDKWFLILDMDEIYTQSIFDEFKLKKKLMPNINVFRTRFENFLNDFWHSYDCGYSNRFFRLTDDVTFVYDNDVTYNNKKPIGINFRYDNFVYHYSYCKPIETFKMKEKWQLERWGVCGHKIENNKIVQNMKLHSDKVKKFEGEHPSIMLKHPLYTIL